MQSPVPGIVPAPDARLLEAEHAQRDAGRDQGQAAVVHPARCPRRHRLGDHDQHQRDDRDRDVDPEDRAPRPLRQVAAEDRAHGGQAARDAEEGRQRPSPLAQRVGVDDDGQRGRVHDRAACALKDPEEDQPRLGQAALGRGPAQRRRHGEQHDAEHDHLAVPDGVGEPAAEGEQRRQREQVGIDAPLHPGATEAELVLDVGRRDRDDRLVDERHRDREDHRDQDERLGGLGSGHRSAHLMQLRVGELSIGAEALAA